MELAVDIEKDLGDFRLKTSFRVLNETKGILGASGSGKSMTLRCIAGLERPTRGKITLNDHVLYDSEAGVCLPARKRRIGMLFQNYALFPHMNVLENISFPLDGLEPLERRKRVAEMLAMMQLEGLDKRYPRELSGGQQQRVALARALAIEPQVLLLDEPFSALDNHLRRQMEDQLLTVLEKFHGVALYVSHNMDEAYRICKELIIMDQGSIAASGRRDEIFQRPPTLAAARLVGFTNISRAIEAGNQLVKALDWGCNLEMEKGLYSKDHIGIRSNQIILAEGPGKNVFQLMPKKVIEAPYSVVVKGVILSEGCNEDQASTIDWELEREQWKLMKNLTPPWSIQIPVDKLIPMES
ncbi:sulfate/molybdate ABC transporter ATP-binding protein [Alkaliphilus crotonatoxidans]